MTSTESVESTSLRSLPVEGLLVKTDTKGRWRVRREQRKAVLAQFEQSGLSAAKFAAVAGIKYSTFAGWVQRYRRRKGPVASKPMRFMEAVIASQGPQARSGLVVHLPGAVRVELFSVAEVPVALALIEALQKRGRGC